MKIKQRNIRVFEMECDEEAAFREYVEKNFELLKGFLIVVKGKEQTVGALILKQSGLCCVLHTACMDSGLFGKKESIPQPTLPFGSSLPQEGTPMIEPVVEPEAVKEPALQSVKTALFDRTIRSGEQISVDGDVTIFGRINSGAKVVCAGNAHLFDAVDGSVVCDGEYMLLRSIGAGSVSFKGQELNSKDFDGNLKKVVYKNGIVISAVKGAK